MDDGLIALTRPECIQWEFEILTGLFDRVGLWKNKKKAVGMVFQTFHISGRHSKEYYKGCMTGEGSNNQDCQRQCVRCPDCTSDLVEGYLETHRNMRHRINHIVS